MGDAYSQIAKDLVEDLKRYKAMPGGAAIPYDTYGSNVQILKNRGHTKAAYTHNEVRMKEPLPFINEKLGLIMESLPGHLRDIFRRNVILTGGAISSLIRGETPNDWDLYFRSGDDLIEILNHYLYEYGIKAFYENREIVYRNKFETYEAYFDKTELPKTLVEHGGLHLTDNALSLNMIQFITKHIGEPLDIINTFDFLHCMPYFTYQDGVVIADEMIESIRSKQLYYHGNDHTLGSMLRLNKFLKKGWIIADSELIKLHENIIKQARNETR